MQAEFEVLLDRLAGRGVTIVLSTHDVDFAYRWSDEIHLMAAGRCIASTPAQELDAQREALLAAGQRLPQALALHAELARRGLLPAYAAPRSVEALLAALRAQPVDKHQGEILI
jgi:cobalt/nickel transport system ATP-binding protein